MLNLQMDSANDCTASWKKKKIQHVHIIQRHNLLLKRCCATWETIQEQYCTCVFLFHRRLQLAVVKGRGTGFSCPSFSYRVTLPVVFARQPRNAGGCDWGNWLTRWTQIAVFWYGLWVLCWILKNILAYLRLGTLFSFPQMQVLSNTLASP